MFIVFNSAISNYDDDNNRRLVSVNCSMQVCHCCTIAACQHDYR